MWEAFFIFMGILTNAINKTYTRTLASFSFVNHFWSADLSKSFKMEHRIKTKCMRYRWRGQLLAYVWILWMNASFWLALHINECSYLGIIHTSSPSSKAFLLWFICPLPQHPPSKSNWERLWHYDVIMQSSRYPVYHIYE